MDANVSQFGTTDSPLVASGYIYDLVHALPVVDGTSCSPVNVEDQIWVSPSNFIMFTARKAKLTASTSTLEDGTRTSFTVQVPGALVLPVLSPHTIPIDSVPETHRKRLSMIGSLGAFSFKESKLASFVEQLATQKGHPAFKKLKKYQRSTAFPYTHPSMYLSMSSVL